MIRSFGIALMWLATGSASADQIWDLRKQVQVQTLEEAVGDATLVVSGEFHYDPATIAVHARLAQVLGHGSLIGWEFLNRIDQARISDVIQRLQTLQITLDQAMAELFPGQQAPIEYNPILELVKEGAADLIPLNLTRAQKSPVTKGGIEAVDPALLPPDFAMGSDLYFERFKEAMGPHPLPNPIENYFASQSLTDDVMAHALLEAPAPNGKKLMITGAFHGDYREGAVARLEARDPKNPAVYVKVMHEVDLEGQTLDAILVDEKYGRIADVIYLIEEKPANQTPIKVQR